MESVAGFILMLMIYFLGSLAFVQEIIRPHYHSVPEGINPKKQPATNYPKIILSSFAVSLITTSLIYFLFMQ